MSSRELRAVLETFTETSSALGAYWERHAAGAPLAALRDLVDRADRLADELEHAAYDHARALRCARLLLDAGLAFLDTIEAELVAPGVVAAGLRETRGAALTFLETIAGYVAPSGALRAA